MDEPFLWRKFLKQLHDGKDHWVQLFDVQKWFSIQTARWVCLWLAVNEVCQRLDIVGVIVLNHPVALTGSNDFYCRNNNIFNWVGWTLIHTGADLSDCFKLRLPLLVAFSFGSCANYLPFNALRRENFISLSAKVALKSRLALSWTNLRLDGLSCVDDIRAHGEILNILLKHLLLYNFSLFNWFLLHNRRS